MEVANTQAYYDTATITAVKSFTVQAPKLKMHHSAKLDCFEIEMKGDIQG
jgi:hypothetical protein